MESKHTPGPWEVEAEGNQKSCIKPAASWAPIFRSCEETREADLMLAAAAPELLEALEACLLREDIADGEIGDMIRAAIAKARGEAR